MPILKRIKKTPVGPCKHLVQVSSLIDVGIHMNKLTGDPCVGMAVLEAALSERPEVTVDYVTERLNGLYSDDTVRRKLRAMAKLEVLKSRKAGRTLYYWLHPEIIANALDHIRGDKS